MGARIAVVGAGLAGLACAQRLHAQGCAVTLFDKARRPGGRLATRRADGLLFDHGAQYATARGAGFQAFIAEAGDLIAPWDPAAAHPRWVGVPGMSAFAQAAERRGIGTLHANRQVTFISRGADGWRLRHQDAATVRPGAVTDAGERAGPFDRLVLALPPTQAAPLLASLAHAFAEAAAAVEMQPCWCLMLAFDERQPGPDTRTLEDGPPSWIARDSSRPGRAPLPDTWIVHASPSWSRDHLEHEVGFVRPALREAFAATTGIGAEPRLAAVHRWRYARTETPLGRACLWDPAGLAVCGDWCLGAKVEAAFDSGRAAAEACL